MLEDCVEFGIVERCRGRTHVHQGLQHEVDPAASARGRSPQNGTVCLPVVGSCDTGAVTADPVAPLRVLLTEAGFAGSAHWWIEPQSASGSPSRPFEIEPYEYLQWAEQALEERTTAGDVHAILDAKRAIDSVTDRLLDIAGIDRSGLSRRKRMEAIARMHVAAPRIIQKLTDTRNTLEHDYRRPSHDEAETAVDVATLFFAASRHLEVLFPNEFALGTTTQMSASSSADGGRSRGSRTGDSVSGRPTRSRRSVPRTQRSRSSSASPCRATWNTARRKPSWPSAATSVSDPSRSLMDVGGCWHD